MAPHTTTVTQTVEEVKERRQTVPMRIVWRNVIIMGSLHIGSLYGAYLLFTQAMWKTVLYFLFLYVISGLGITAGAHRLWSHRSYKAKLPLRILLVIFNTIAFQNHVFEWARDHRVHHKYSETDADPHNATRGFFFSHVGWLLVRKHPDVIKKGKTIDLSDLYDDPVIMFQKRHFLAMALVFSLIVPTAVPMLLWGETFWNSYFVCCILRYCFVLNMTWLVNSAAHMWGYRPYDKHINPRENIFVCLGAIGEGFHNYHHVFPWDYSTSEFGIKYNITTLFIDFMAWIGWAYDRKTVSPSVIEQRKMRTGEQEGHKLQ